MAPRALEDLAAFAYTRGGTLLVGIRDDGEIVGATVDDRKTQKIANLIAAHLGITLVRLGVLEWKGTTGRDVYYTLTAHKGLKGLSMSPKTAQEGPKGPQGAGEEHDA